MSYSNASGVPQGIPLLRRCRADGVAGGACSEIWVPYPAAWVGRFSTVRLQAPGPQGNDLRRTTCTMAVAWLVGLPFPCAWSSVDPATAPPIQHDSNLTTYGSEPSLQ